MLRITEIIAPVEEGITSPYLCEAEDGHRYVVKSIKCGHEVLVHEWVGAKLAQALSLPLPPFEAVSFDPRLVKYAANPEAGLLAQEPGFASRYVDPNTLLSAGLLSRVSRQLQARILWFDAWISNGDRKDWNPNLLWLPDQSEVRLIDHHNAFTERELTRGLFETHILRGSRSVLDATEKASLRSEFSDILTELRGIWQTVPHDWIERGCSTTLEVVDTTLRHCEGDDFWT